jgi:cytochrome c553
MSKLSIWVIALLACTAAVLAQNAPSHLGYLEKAEFDQQGSVLSAVANDPRPLAQMFDGLATRFNWHLNYEDPRFDWPDDVKVVPSGALFSVSIPDFESSDPKNEFRTLDAIIKSYNQTSNPGRFELRTFDDGTFVAVGIAAAHGPQTPIMDTKITLKTSTVSARDAVDQWARELSRVSGVHVIYGGPMMNAQIAIDVENVTARDALRQIIKALGANRCWTLYFNGTSKTYTLNLIYRKNIGTLGATSTKSATPPIPPANQSLVAQGKARYLYYKCDECHGANGEGGGDGPELTTTLLDAAEISKFLEKPSPDAYMKGMPDIPATNPDHQALVAFVLSLKHPPN